MDEVEEVMGVVDYPFKRSRDAELLVHAILKFCNGKTATL